jgi:diaminopropionate ammonia-lyase
VGVGLLCRLATDAGMGEIKERFGLGPESVVLCFSTEGDTDPETYRAIVDGPAP